MIIPEETTNRLRNFPDGFIPPCTFWWLCLVELNTTPQENIDPITVYPAVLCDDVFTMFFVVLVSYAQPPWYDPTPWSHPLPCFSPSVSFKASFLSSCIPWKHKLYFFSLESEAWTAEMAPRRRKEMLAFRISESNQSKNRWRIENICNKRGREKKWERWWQKPDILASKWPGAF